jgi:uncharacterized protein YeaO (DUF488 family)
MSARIRAANIKLKRAYEPPDADDGVRALVDRLWPRRVMMRRSWSPYLPREGIG